MGTEIKSLYALIDELTPECREAARKFIESLLAEQDTPKAHLDADATEEKRRSGLAFLKRLVKEPPVMTPDEQKEFNRIIMEERELNLTDFRNPVTER